MRYYHDIIVKPVMTEKSMNLQAENKYTFIVDKLANKTEIKNAVEKVFNVKVKKVYTMNIKGKPKRMGRYVGKTPDRKKAIIALEEGYTIKLFEGI